MISLGLQIPKDDDVTFKNKVYHLSITLEGRCPYCDEVDSLTVHKVAPETKQIQKEVLSLLDMVRDQPCVKCKQSPGLIMVRGARS